MNQIEDLIIEISNNKLNEVMRRGFALSGNNGPYYCKDTPIRNSAHWCVTYSYLYTKYYDSRYLEAVIILANYLMEEQNNSYNNTVCCMRDAKFDSINGLIGQAWAIEGLISAAKATGRRRYYECAKKIFLAQEFLEKTGLWKKIDTDGKNLGYDIAFNHQLWFAAMGAMICSVEDDLVIHFRVDCFMRKCHEHFRIHKDGLIRHFGDFEKMSIKKTIKKTILFLTSSILFQKNPDRFGINTYEASYQLFNLYGFALIRDLLGEYDFFSSKDFKSALMYGLNINKINRMVNAVPQSSRIGKFSYAYNSPAFEYPYVLKIFGNYIEDDKNIVNDLFEFQVTNFYSNSTKMFDKNTDDPETLTARVYELARWIFNQ